MTIKKDSFKTNQPTSDFLLKLQNDVSPPCISLYMTTHLHHPDNLQDPIRFKQLIKDIQASLSKKYPSKEVSQLIKPFEDLLSDQSFWNHTTEGIGIFSTKDFFEIVPLNSSVKDLIVVADSFHTKPLRQYLQTMDRYHLLCVSLNSVQLFEGNRHSLIEIDLPNDFPKTMKEALGHELTDKHSTVASYGGVGVNSSNMHHGHGGKKEEMDIDAERFLRVISNLIQDRYSKPTGLPLILAALSEHHHIFHRVSKNALLLKQGVLVNPFAISLDTLKTMAWEIMENQYKSLIDDLTHQFKHAETLGKGSDKISDILRGIVAKNVEKLFIEENKILAAKIDIETKLITLLPDIDDPTIDDLFDDLGELVLAQGGQVVILPLECMPTNTGIAAIYRY